MYKTAV